MNSGPGNASSSMTVTQPKRSIAHSTESTTARRSPKLESRKRVSTEQFQSIAATACSTSRTFNSSTELPNFGPSTAKSMVWGSKVRN